MKYIYIILFMGIFGVFCTYTGYIAGHNEAQEQISNLSDAIRCHKDRGCDSIFADTELFNVDTLDLYTWGKRH